MKDSIHFFLGSQSPHGFYSLFDGLYDPYSSSRCYILKGGPGTGKSTFMKRVAESAENCGYTVEYINCASDPDSLDAVIINEKNVCIVDGTSPHIIEPVFPGVSEQLIDLSEYWDKKVLLKKADEIRRLTDENRLCYTRAVRFLKGAAVLRKDTAKIADLYTDGDKIKNFADRTVKRETRKLRDKTGKTVRRFISAVTPQGIYIHGRTLNSMCSSITGIEGFPSAAGKLMKEIASACVSRGNDVIVCPSFLDPAGDPECIIIPSCSKAYISTELNTDMIAFDRIIHTSRFMRTGISESKSRIKFNKRLCAELTQQAVSSLECAKSIHDSLEKIYMSAMNYKKCEKRCDAVISEILKMPDIKTR